MTRNERANVIVGLRERGWTDSEITDFMLYVATHVPTDDEIGKSIEEKKTNEEL